MNLPPLQAISNSHFHVSGDVTIDPNAVIAPGVILQADPNSQLVIASGVCIGMGAILHAYQGRLELGTGANLGAGVLVIGEGKIGANACIGSATTIFNSSVEGGQVVPPGSLLGDRGRQIADNQGNGAVATPAASEPSQNHHTPESSESENQGSNVYGQQQLDQLLTENQGNGAVATPAASEPSQNHHTPESSESENQGSNVYGQQQLDQLLGKLLPYRRH
jgi:carbon dioxide concentrating mechanism protein CcmN